MKAGSNPLCDSRKKEREPVRRELTLDNSLLVGLGLNYVPPVHSLAIPATSPLESLG